MKQEKNRSFEKFLTNLTRSFDKEQMGSLKILIMQTNLLQDQSRKKR